MNFLHRHFIWALALMTLAAGCLKEKNAPVKLTGPPPPLIDTVTSMKLVYSTSFNQLDQIDISGKMATSAFDYIFYYGDKSGLGVPPTATWPLNIYYIWRGLFLSVDRIYTKTDSFVVYKLDTSLYYQPAFAILNANRQTPGTLLPDTLGEIVLSPGATIAVYAPKSNRPNDSTLTSNYNTCIFQLNDLYTRYWCWWYP